MKYDNTISKEIALLTQQLTFASADKAKEIISKIRKLKAVVNDPKWDLAEEC